MTLEAFGQPVLTTIRHCSSYEANQVDVTNESEEHTMTEGVKTNMYPVTDLARTLYSRLVGVEPYMDRAAQQEVRDVGGGKSLASVTDTDGNVIGLLQVS